MQNNKRETILPAMLGNNEEHGISLLKNIQGITVAELIEYYVYSEAIVETVREPLLILRGDLTVKTANRSFFDTFQVSKKETYNKTLFELGNGQWNILSLKKLLKNVLPKNSHFDDFTVEHVFEHIGKKIMLLNARRIVLEGHKTQLILLAIEDITDKNKHEENLQQYPILLENIPDAVITADHKHRIKTWNKGAEKIYGWKAEEVVGKAARPILQTKFPSLKKKPVPEKLFEKGYWKGEIIQKRKNGTNIHVFASTTILKDKKGKTLGSLSINRDITEQKKAEENLKESQNNLLFLTEASKILSSSLDYNTTLQGVAKIAIPHIADWCGVDILDAHGELQQVAVAHKDPKKVAWAKAYRKTHPPKMSETTGTPQVIKTKKSVLYPLITDEMLVASAKNKKDLELSRSLNITSVMIVPIISNAKAIGAITFVTTDGKRQYFVTDLAMAEELASRAALAIENASLYSQAQKEIQQRKKLEKQKDEFIGVASHELKTPVTSIKSFAQVLRLKFTKEGNKNAAELLGKLDAQVDKLTNLIGDLLDVTKIEAGRMQFNEDYFAFDELIYEIREELQRTTNKHSISIQGKTTKTIFGDRERIGQVLTNLISNAIKYSPYSKDIIIHVSVENKNIKLCVQDFGVGIAKDKQDKVFERFFRVSGPDKETYPGLGLGLYISSEIIKRLKGRLWVESVEGKGSTFCFTLPITGKKQKKTADNQAFAEEAITHE